VSAGVAETDVLRVAVDVADRLLANIETATEKLLPLVLAGQPELAERLNHPSLRQLKQRVALLRTFLFQTDIMLLDEPFGALDALTRSALQEWLSGVSVQHRRTILFITHDVEEAIFLGDRVLVMSSRPGRVKLEAPVPFERPRPGNVITAPEFVAIKRRILDAIREERTPPEPPAPGRLP